MNKEKKGNMVFIARKKQSTCTLWFSKWETCVNKLSMAKYFDNIYMNIERINNVLKIFNLDTLTFKCNVKGGGKASQSLSIVFALAKALRYKFKTEFVNEESKYKQYNHTLRENNLLTIDRRSVEPKKYGYAKARKKRQRSKR